MHFIFYFNPSEDKIETDNINSNYAPSYIAESVEPVSFHKMKGFIYHYKNHLDLNNIIENTVDYFYYSDGIFFPKNEKFDIKKAAYNQTLTYQDIIGDYLICNLDKNGNGKINRPVGSSFRQLFYYEDGDIQILSSDISLIVKSVKKILQSKLLDYMNPAFIEDAIFRPTVKTKRKAPRGTFLNTITRIDPLFLHISFNDFRVKITKKKLEQVIDKKLDNLFVNNRSEFYQLIIERIKQSSTILFSNIKLDNYYMYLTGGLDSRVALAVLLWLKDKLPLKFKTKTYGLRRNPDVIIASQIAQKCKLDFEQTLLHDENDLNWPNTLNDYVNAFTISWGTFSSYTYRFLRTKQDFQKQNGLGIYKYSEELETWSRLSACYREDSEVIPLLLDYEIMQFKLLCNKYKLKVEHKTLVYEIINHFQPQLLEIPFAGIEMPKTNIKAEYNARDTNLYIARLFKAYFNEDLVKEFFNKINSKSDVFNFRIDKIRTERMKRTCMDFASVYNLTGQDILDFSQKEYKHEKPAEISPPTLEKELELRLQIFSLERSLHSPIEYLSKKSFKRRLKLAFKLIFHSSK